MSVARQVEVAYNLDVLAQVAAELGYLVRRQGGANGWYGVMKGAENCGLVITSKQHRFDMGFVQQPDGKTKMYADFHGGHVQADMADKIIPRYLEKMAERSMKVTRRVNTHKEVVLHLERR